MRLGGKRALVTGGGTGIGREIGLALAAAGARVALCGRRPEPLQDVANRISNAGGTALPIVADVGDEASVQQLAEQVDHAFGGIDILVNNAAQFGGGPVAEMAIADFDRVLRTNLRGPFLVSRAFLPGMQARQHGSIVMIGSTSGKRCDAGGSAYSASKFGLVGLSQSLFQEVRRDNIRVIMLYPSSVDTRDATDKPADGKGSRLCAEDIAAAVVDAVSLPGRASIREIELWATNP